MSRSGDGDRVPYFRLVAGVGDPGRQQGQALKLLLDGRPPTPEEVAALTLGGYGHSTAMQVTGRAVQGLDLHMTRLQEATRTLLGLELDVPFVRAQLRTSLGSQEDATLRVYVYEHPGAGGLAHLVEVGLPRPAGRGLRDYMSVRYQRPLPQIKHVGTFGKQVHVRAGIALGFDSALLVSDQGLVVEGATTNVGFLEADGVVWPEAPALEGVAMQLLGGALDAQGLGQSRRAVRLEDVGQFEAVIATNSRGVFEVSRIDGHRFPGRPEVLRRVRAALASAPWQEL